MDVSLTERLEAFVRAKVDEGLYNDASEVVREALRLMWEREGVNRLKLERLREALAVGEADLSSGSSTEISGDQELAEFFDRL